MRSQLIDVLKSIAYDVKLISSYSDTIPADSKTQLLEMINDIKRQVAFEAELSSLSKPFYIKLLPFYTTGTIAIVQGTTTITGAATVFTSGMVGRKIQIGSDANVYTITEYTGALVIEIDRPFLGTTETTATFTIFQDEYSAPPEVLKIVSLTDYISPGRLVQEFSQKELLNQYPDPTKYFSDALIYSKFTSEITSEAATATAATDTTLTMGALAGTLNDDYYKGWLLYDETLGKTVRIASYVNSTAVATLEEAITGMAITDTLYLKRVGWKLLVRSVPDYSDRYLYGVGIMYPQKLVNDYDIETDIPEGFSEDILKAGVVLRWKEVNGIGNQTAYLAAKQTYTELLEAVSKFESKVINRKYVFRRGPSMYQELNPINGGGWPAYPNNV